MAYSAHSYAVNIGSSIVFHPTRVSELANVLSVFLPLEMVHDNGQS